MQVLVRLLQGDVPPPAGALKRSSPCVMVTTTTFAGHSNARQRALALVLAGGILFVIGFGGPSILLSAGLGHAGSGFAGQA